MWFKAILPMLAICVTGFAEDSTEAIWREAYFGNISLVHKLMLSQPEVTVEDHVTKLFIMLYAHYRNDDLGRASGYLYHINKYLESEFNDNQLIKK